MENLNEHTFLVSIAIQHLPVEDQEHINHQAYTLHACQGIVEYSLDEARVDQILGERSYSGGDIPLEVMAEVEAELALDTEVENQYYFYSDLKAQDFIQYCQQQFEKINPKISKIKNEDWNEEWKKHYQPIPISDSMIIIPAWEKKNFKSDHETKIYINPGMGFGTGDHATTFLCLKYLEIYQRNAQKILDFGSGSGILGIAAHLMGAQAVDLFEIDPASMRNARDNVFLNTKKDPSSINYFLTPDKENLAPQYELILANILQNVLLDEKEWIINRLAPNGILILSGLLIPQMDETLLAYTGSFPQNLILIDREEKGDWGVLVLRKRSMQ
jgi:ribosomal protein L11 methyltransferase